MTDYWDVLNRYQASRVRYTWVPWWDNLDRATGEPARPPGPSPYSDPAAFMRVRKELWWWPADSQYGEGWDIREPLWPAGLCLSDCGGFMKQYRKKPVVIEAVEVTTNPTDVERARAWCKGLMAESGGIEIGTLEGTMRADIGDWIIRGVKGEFYPCKPDIFTATYDPVE